MRYRDTHLQPVKERNGGLDAVFPLGRVLPLEAFGHTRLLCLVDPTLHHVAVIRWVRGWDLFLGLLGGAILPLAVLRLQDQKADLCQLALLLVAIKGAGEA